jgi:hypothetical protein
MMRKAANLTNKPSNKMALQRICYQKSRSARGEPHYGLTWSVTGGLQIDGNLPLTIPNIQLS